MLPQYGNIPNGKAGRMAEGIAIAPRNHSRHLNDYLLARSFCKSQKADVVRTFAATSEPKAIYQRSLSMCSTIRSRCLWLVSKCRWFCCIICFRIRNSSEVIGGGVKAAAKPPHTENDGGKGYCNLK